jgi:hypothetical protein
MLALKTLLAVGTPRASGPENPRNKYGLKEQPDKASAIRIQTERVSMVRELRDIPWEDTDKKCGCNPTELDLQPWEKKQSCAESNLEHARQDHNMVRREGQPRWYLGKEVPAGIGEVGYSGVNQHGAEKHSPN